MTTAAIVILATVFQMFTPPLRTIDRGTMSQIEDARFVTIRSQPEWSALWRTHAPGKPLPPVDWSREMVVGVFLGTRPAAGFGVEIVGYREEGARVVAGYKETPPARDAITAQILTSPYALAAIPRRSGDVAFEKVD
ncbi:MAG TPA: protease complex subunit PrcB family protein [Vicinamibacterales bacterium]